MRPAVILMMMLPLSAAAQEVRSDSLPDLGLPDSITALPRDPAPGLSLPLLPSTTSGDGPMRQLPLVSSEFSVPTIAPGVISPWQGGSFTGSAARRSLPGLMGVESGTLTLSQSVENFTVEAYGSAVKYGWYRGLQTSWGFGGSLTYRFSEKVSLTMFGSYYTKTKGMTPAMWGYVNVPHFGGYADLRLSDRWGVKVGARAYHSLTSGHWDVAPIVEPYYRLNKNTSIGVDVGGILYHVIYQLVERNRGRGFGFRGNPTMPPPVGH